MDVDHLYDYYQLYIRGKPNRIYILFHAWEYSVIGLVLVGAMFFHPFFLAAAVAHLFHVATDHFHNPLSPFSYFIVYRIAKRFDSAAIVPGYNMMYAFRRWPTLFPFGQRLTPWFRRNIDPWFEERVRRVAQASSYQTKE